MPFNRYPPPMPLPPATWDDKGLTGGSQAECVYGKFGDGNSTAHQMKTPAQRIKPVSDKDGIKVFSSGGMSCCSAVFLRCPHAHGTIGAAIHFDGGGDPGAMFQKVLGYYNMNNAAGIAASSTYLVLSASVDMTAHAAYNSLVAAGFVVAGQFAHNGAACMDVNGRVFNQYL